MQGHLAAGKLLSRTESSRPGRRGTNTFRRGAAVGRRGTMAPRRESQQGRISGGHPTLLADMMGNSAFWKDLSTNFLNGLSQEQSVRNTHSRPIHGSECSVVSEDSLEDLQGSQMIQYDCDVTLEVPLPGNNKRRKSKQLCNDESLTGTLLTEKMGKSERLDSSRCFEGTNMGSMRVEPSRSLRRRSTMLPQDKQLEMEILVHQIIDERFYGEEQPSDIFSNNKEGSEDDIEWHSPFVENIYTLMYMCAFKSYAFWYALFVYGVQMATITLTLVDVLDIGAADGNVLAIPPMVDMTVTCAQAICLLMALAYQSDFIEALLKIQDGFYPEVLEQHSGATYSTWLISCVTQLTAGLLLVYTVFILTVQVEDVLSVMLNFAALHFMAEIDDIGFVLARLGFIRTQLQQEAEAVVDFQVPQRKRRNYSRRILYLLALAGLFTGYGVIKAKQINGEYLQSNVYVQFGDSYNPQLAFYSGIFESKMKWTIWHRKYEDTATKSLLLSYCWTESIWTFSKENDSCNYFAKAPSNTYDVTKIPASEWMVRDSNGRFHPFESFSTVGRDCDPSVCNGRCEDGVCGCPDGYFGMDCEFSNVCPQLSTDKRFQAFPVVAKTQWGGAISDSYELLKNTVTGKNVQVYNMPVYYSSKTHPANIIFFGGKRWVLTSEGGLFNLTKARKANPSRRSFPELTVSIFENGFHGYHQANYTPFLLSDPVEYQTPTFLPTPSGLGWWSVHRGTDNKARYYVPDRSVGTVLTCKTCDTDQGGCDSVGGYCDHRTGQCSCYDGFKGNRCEVQKACFEEDNPCGGHGLCDKVTGLCRCDLPHYGKLCDYHYACYEEYGSCTNNGTCNVTTGHCHCDDPAIFGEKCEKKADCHTLGCSNGGLCGVDGECACRPPFTGRLCDLVDKTKENLLVCGADGDCSAGTCIVDTGICSCADPSAFGTLCEHQFNCTEPWFNCVNGGTCNGSTGICECPDSYFGPDCSRVPLCSKDSDCGSEPNRCDVDSGLCHCKYGPTTGRMCEIDNTDACSIVGCANGGVCNDAGHCECPSPYTGRLCEAFTSELPTPNSIDGLTGGDYHGKLLNCLQDSKWMFPPDGSDEFCNHLLEDRMHMEAGFLP